MFNIAKCFFLNENRMWIPLSFSNLYYYRWIIIYRSEVANLPLSFFDQVAIFYYYMAICFCFSFQAEDYCPFPGVYEVIIKREDTGLTAFGIWSTIYLWIRLHQVEYMLICIKWIYRDNSEMNVYQLGYRWCGYGGSRVYILGTSLTFVAEGLRVWLIIPIILWIFLMTFYLRRIV